MPPTLPNTLTNGQTADASQVMADLNAINAAVDQATVTSLPGSPYDGQEIYYLADATNGVVWHLKYRSGSASASKWEMAGGGDLFSEVATDESVAAGTTTYAALATAGPSVTVPLAGDYDVTIASMAYPNGTGQFVYHSYDIGGTGAGDGDASIASAAANINSLLGRRRRKTGLAASTALVSKYKHNSAAAAGGFQARSMTVRPVRVG